MSKWNRNQQALKMMAKRKAEQEKLDARAEIIDRTEGRCFPEGALDAARTASDAHAQLKPINTREYKTIKKEQNK